MAVDEIQSDLESSSKSQNRLLRPDQTKSTELLGWCTPGASSLQIESKDTIGEGSLLYYDDLPAWYQDNHLICTGYRPVSFSYQLCLQSWKYFHNETINIYSHAIPAAFFLLSETWAYPFIYEHYPNAKPIDHLVIAFFLLTAAICLSLSATYHTLMNHSQDVSMLFLKLDFVGILVLTLGDLVSGTYMIFYCEQKWRWIYWGVIFVLAIITAILLVHSRLQGLRWRAFRTTAFVATAFFIVAPIGHGIWMFGFKQMIKQSGLPYYFLEGALFGIGASFYATRMPERYMRGKSDFIGCSHQLFHIFVVLATAVHLVGLMMAFDYNYKHRECVVS